MKYVITAARHNFPTQFVRYLKAETTLSSVRTCPLLLPLLLLLFLPLPAEECVINVVRDCSATHRIVSALPKRETAKTATGPSTGQRNRSLERES